MPYFVTLSQKELHRLEAVQKIRERRLTVTQAAELLHLSRSQVHRLLQAYDRDGAAGLVSRKRGRLTNLPPTGLCNPDQRCPVGG
jgi:predicted transcriptional regulator